MTHSLEARVADPKRFYGDPEHTFCNDEDPDLSFPDKLEQIKRNQLPPQLSVPEPDLSRFI